MASKNQPAQNKPQTQEKSATLVLAVFFAFVVGVALASAIFGNIGGGGSVDESKVKAIVLNMMEHEQADVMAALQRGRGKAEEKQRADASKNLEEYKGKLEANPDAPIAGNPNGDVVVVEFYDYNCGFCKRAMPDVAKIIETDKNVKVVFLDHPILAPSSTLAAKAALAVHKISPDKFFAYHQELMKITGDKTEELLLATAKKIGVNADKVKSEMNSGAIEKIIAENNKLAEAVGVQGVPGFVIGGQFFGGAIGYDAMVKAIEEARKKS